MPPSPDVGAAVDLGSTAPDLSSPDAQASCAYSTADYCPAAVCTFPLDWQSAQQPSAWCRGTVEASPVSISLCRTVEGYDRVWTAYDFGGEFFLYDPVTGAFVQRRSDAKALYACLVTAPGGPATAVPNCVGPESSFPVVCPQPGDVGPPSVDSGSPDAAPAALPACGMPKIDQGDAAPGQCKVDRTLLSCLLPDGSSEICTSDNPASCPDLGVAAIQSCIDRCAANEYAIACGAPGPSSGNFAPPAVLNCHATVYTPGGVVFYCCPCP
jgi:hypothetical protein